MTSPRLKQRVTILNKPLPLSNPLFVPEKLTNPFFYNDSCRVISERLFIHNVYTNLAIDSSSWTETGFLVFNEMKRLKIQILLLQAIPIIIGTMTLMVLTVVGNFLVIWSYKINRKLRSINNMLLVSLAVSDLVIGLVSMNLYPYLIINGEWGLGPHVCTLWLCIDYTLSMASVVNLCLICFDRYFSVTRPFTYRSVCIVHAETFISQKSKAQLIQKKKCA